MKTPVLNINQFQESKSINDLYVNSFSNHMELNKKLIDKPHSHNFYLCVMFTKGFGKHEIDFNSYIVNPGKVFFLKPGQTHFWKFNSNPEGYIFFHSKEFYDLHFLNHSLNSFPFYYSNQNPPLLELPQSKTNALTLKFQEIHNEYQQKKLFRELKIANLINSIYIDLTRDYTAHTNLEKLVSPNYTNILTRFESLINEHYYNEKFPKFYANQLNITTKHLNRVVKKALNKTSNQLISERIILESKRLIIHTNNNLDSIANTLNFSDYAYFSKFFKSKTGINPMTFKKKYS